MKLILIAALAGVLAAPLGGTASAEITTYPVKEQKLTASPLYKTGPLPSTTCAEKPVKRNDRKKARAYFDAVIDCLETTWEQHLTTAGLPYEKVKVRHMTRIPKKYCGMDIGKEDSQAWYCSDNGTIAVQMGREWLSEPDDLWLFDMASYVYAYHVQELVEIGPAFEKLPYGKKAELQEQIRRSTLQANCLAAAFLKSVWPLEGRTAKDWNHLVDLLDSVGEKESYGKPATIRHWVKRGFSTADPGSCNTWSVPHTKVA
ncbi:hypothetical protein ACIBP6_43945 [Nonomuraea terrae]|uniref:hypothetical protein n=1 Tax=Nonomuraea terrae TaxID=2530383 RepID=UPI0037B72502